MNEKMIRGIAFDSYSGKHQTFDEILFAKLIINECIKICDDTENEYLTAESEQLLGEDNHKFAIGAGVCCNRIKLKFGIE